MASKRVDEYSTATPADADQAIAIDASDTTDSSAGTVKRFVLSDLFTYVLNKILARVNTWTAVNTFTAGSARQICLPQQRQRQHINRSIVILRPLPRYPQPCLGAHSWRLRMLQHFAQQRVR
jgi:hypothetical protein